MAQSDLHRRTLVAPGHFGGLVAGQPGWVNLEIKPGPGRRLAHGEVVANEAARPVAGRQKSPLLSSFEVESLQAAKLAQPDLPRALLLDSWVDNG